MKKNLLFGIALMMVAMLPVQTKAQDCNEPSITSATVTFKYGSAAPAGVYSEKAKFKVCASPERWVYFSRGNLQFGVQYESDPNTGGYIPQNFHSTLEGTKYGQWRFAEHQYDLADPQSLIVHYQASDHVRWQDMFAYGTSQWEYTDVATGKYYYNGPEALVDGNSTMQFMDHDLTGDWKKSDWGVYNTILDGETETEGPWRTLTKDEWQYMITNNTNGFCQITLDNSTVIKGAFFLPNEWENPLPGVITINASATLYNGNAWTQAQWEKLEESGVLFLPAAGYISKPLTGSASLQGQNEAGYYYTSTFYQTGYSLSQNTSYVVHFGKEGYSNLKPHFMDYIVRTPQSVRLVQDIEE